MVVELLGAGSEPTRLVGKVGGPRDNSSTCDIVNIPCNWELLGSRFREVRAREGCVG